MTEPLPTVFLPYQSRWVSDQAPISLIEKSRRIGISWAEGGDSVVESASSHGCDTWYVGYNKDMAVEFIRDCAMFARALGAKHDGVQLDVFDDDNPDRNILVYTIRFASGYRISALSSRPTNLRGKRGRIIIDEAAFHPDLRGLLKSALAVKMWGGRAKVKLISTHNGVDCDFYKILEEVLNKKRPYSHHRVTIHDALREGYFKRICYVNQQRALEEGDQAKYRQWAWSQGRQDEWLKNLFAEYGDDAAEELECVPARSGGTYIHRRLVERQMYPGEVYRLELDNAFMDKREKEQIRWATHWCEANLKLALEEWPRRPTFFGEDFGRVADRTVLAPGYLTQRLVRKFPWAVEMLNVPFTVQMAVIEYVVDRLRKRGVFIGGAMDAGGNGAYVAEQAAKRYGKRIDQVKLSEKWYVEYLPRFKKAFEDDLIHVVRDADHLTDLTAFKRVNGIPKLPKTKTKSVDGPDRHGDAGVAYLLGYVASLRTAPNYGGYQSATVRGRHARDDDDYI